MGQRTRASFRYIRSVSSHRSTGRVLRGDRGNLPAVLLVLFAGWREDATAVSDCENRTRAIRWFWGLGRGFSVRGHVELLEAVRSIFKQRQKILELDYGCFRSVRMYCLLSPCL